MGPPVPSPPSVPRSRRLRPRRRSRPCPGCRRRRRWRRRRRPRWGQAIRCRPRRFQTAARGHRRREGEAGRGVWGSAGMRGGHIRRRSGTARDDHPDPARRKRRAPATAVAAGHHPGPCPESACGSRPVLTPQRRGGVRLDCCGGSFLRGRRRRSDGGGASAADGKEEAEREVQPSPRPSPLRAQTGCSPRWPWTEAPNSRSRPWRPTLAQRRSTRGRIFGRGLQGRLRWGAIWSVTSLLGVEPGLGHG